MGRQDAVNAIGYNVRVVCGFPGVGKTRARSDKTIDLNLNHVPEEYCIDVIRSKLGSGKVLMLSTWYFLRRELRKANIEYAVVYPHPKLKQQYLDMLEKRGRNGKNYMNKMRSRWDTMMRGCLDDPTPYHIVLETMDEHLVDFI